MHLFRLSGLSTARVYRIETASVLLVCGMLLSSCAPRTAEPAGEGVPVWGRFERAFTASTPAPGDADLAVHFTAPSGAVRTVKAFWDGGDVWKVRFMPDEEGAWTYRTELEPAVDGLSGQSGAFAAVPAEGSDNRFLQHGAIRVSDSGRYFVHADGTPFFWLGDTAWSGALKSTDEAWETYLDDRQEKHFTGIQLVTTQWRAGEANLEGLTAYSGFDDIEINPEFFRRMDARIDAVNERGMLVAPVMLWTLGEPEENPGKLPEDQAIELAEYLVARYGANHVFWFLAGDENFSGETGARWRRIGQAVFEDPYRAPVTIHPQGMQWHFDDFLNEDWLDVIIYQSGHGDDARTLEWIHSGPPAQKWSSVPARPVINSEPPYEDHVAYQSQQPHSAYNVRRAVYWSLMNAPTAGVTYGGHGIWSWETEPTVPREHPNAGVAKPWHEAMELPGSEDMKHVADLFTSFDWWRLQPDQSILASQPGGGDPSHFVSTARSEAGDLAVVYLPVGGTVSLREGVLADGLNAEWYDPRDGTRREAQAEGNGTFTAPDGQDWVLVFSE